MKKIKKRKRVTKSSSTIETPTEKDVEVKETKPKISKRSKKVLKEEIEKKDDLTEDFEERDLEESTLNEDSILEENDSPSFDNNQPSITTVSIKKEKNRLAFINS